MLYLVDADRFRIDQAERIRVFDEDRRKDAKEGRGVLCAFASWREIRFLTQLQPHLGTGGAAAEFGCGALVSGDFEVARAAGDQ